MSKSDNKCAACGQWSGKGHKCPPPTAQTSQPVPGMPADSGISPDTAVADRVARAQAAMPTADGRMKLSSETVHALAERIAPLDTPEVRERYLRGDFPRADHVQDLNKRYRWDLFYAARGSSVLPEDTYDSHVDTALKRIVPPLK